MKESIVCAEVNPSHNDLQEVEPDDLPYSEEDIQEIIQKSEDLAC
jgi:hypothetical protein